MTLGDASSEAVLQGLLAPDLFPRVPTHCESDSSRQSPEIMLNGVALAGFGILGQAYEQGRIISQGALWLA